MNKNRPDREFKEKVVKIRRVSKKTKGGNQIGFSATLVIGDHKGQVGIGMAKAKDVVGAIRKASRKAKKTLIRVPMINGTITHEITVKRGAAKVILKPAPKGTGVIAGGAIRAVVEAAGITDIVSKVMGTNNQISNVKAGYHALSMLKPVSEMKGKLSRHHKAPSHKPDQPLSSSTQPPKSSDKKPAAKQKSTNLSANNPTK